MLLKFDNGEIKIFNVKPYISGAWYGELNDKNYFRSVSVDGFTAIWPNGQDLCPDELYYSSDAVNEKNRKRGVEK